jgi:hypothetical protein
MIKVARSRFIILEGHVKTCPKVQLNWNNIIPQEDSAFFLSMNQQIRFLVENFSFKSNELLFRDSQEDSAFFLSMKFNELLFHDSRAFYHFQFLKSKKRAWVYFHNKALWALDRILHHFLLEKIHL